jgi:HD-GYP domain-containing protein (c-di-GMP phosphodiesterase class II)
VDIPLPARLIAVADAYDAMTTDRPYRNAIPKEEALRRLRAGGGEQWDRTAVDVFMDLLQHDELPNPQTDHALWRVA